MAKNKKKKKAEQYDPNLNDGSKRPVTARIAIGDVNDKYSEYPSNGLTPKRLAAIFREADEGNVLRQMELFEEMEEKDTHLASQLQTRKLAVTGLDWEIQPFGKEEIDKEIAQFVEDALHSIENFEDVIMDMLDAIGKGISFSEIDWDYDVSGKYVIQDITWIHPKKFFWDSMTDEIKVCTREYPSGIELPLNKYVVHKYKARSGHPSRQGILRIVSWMYLFKNYDLKDWVSFCEVFGMPLRLGKYDASASDDDKRALMEAIISLGTDAAGIIPSSTTIEFIEANKTSTVQIYEELARYADEQMSKAVLGQTLTADSGGGSFAQGKVHNEVRHDLTVADCKALATTIRRDIIRPLVIFNFGADSNIPTIGFDCEDSQGLKETAEILKTLSELGLKIPVSHVYKKFAIPKPENGEEILVLAMNSTLSQTVDETRELAMKDESDMPVNQEKAQEQIDRMTIVTAKNAEDIFSEIVQPLLDLVEHSQSLEDIQTRLQDEVEVKKIYEKMQNDNLQDLLEKGMYISNLVGRAI